MAPFKLASLSLPDDVHGCPDIESLLPQEALATLEDCHECMLVPDGAEVKVKEFLDPMLTIRSTRDSSWTCTDEALSEPSMIARRGQASLPCGR